MNIKIYSKKITILALILFINAGISFSQPTKLPAPRQEKLLNELNFLIWNVPNAEKVTVKLRIHRGAAFDPQGKEGTMALLANILFPNVASREFFEEDLGGSLNITTHYDYIQIDATANSDKVLDVLQTLAIAVTNPQIDKETTAEVRQEQIEKVKKLESDPAYIADQAIAKRLFGTFPYGRAKAGTVESLQQIDFADLIFARNRFLTSDNATVAVIGNVRPNLISQAARRYFGGWVKSDGKIPATFRLPDAPEKNIQVIEAARENTSELRFAFRGLARNDKNYYAAEVLEKILEKRMQKRERGNVSVSANSYILPGFMIFQMSEWNLGTLKKSENQIALPADLTKKIANLLNEPITAEEFSTAKNEVLRRFTTDALSDFWLDVHTYKLSSFNNDYQSAQNVKLEDVKSVTEKFKTEPVASVLLFQNPQPAESPENSDN